ncbi:hypothetical protein ACE6H2_014930 [Prunus campanulata]
MPPEAEAAARDSVAVTCWKGKRELEASSADGDWDEDDCSGAGGEEGCGALTEASDGDGGREISDGVLGEGESAAGCSDGVCEGCGRDDEDIMEN